MNTDSLIQELAALTLANTAKPDDVEMFNARVNRLSVLIGALQAQASAEALAAYRRAEQGGARYETPDHLVLLTALGAGAVTPEAMTAALAAFKAARAYAPEVAEPLTPPDTLTDEQAAWYLDQLREEFAQHGVPQTVAYAKQHWQEHGRPQGRRWAPGSPGFGPRWSDRP